MARTLIMPKLGLTMTEGALAQWLVRPGQAFKKGDAIFVVETEKAANEIEADADGVIDEFLVAEGATVPVGAPLARWTCDQPMAPATSKPRVKLRPQVRDAAPASPSEMVVIPRAGRIIATPYARRLARAARLDLATVSTTRIRITAQDVLRTLKGR